MPDPKTSLPELRHTAAHVLAYAVQDLFPEAKPTIGPAIENGFYYDFDRATPFTPEDLEKLNARMAEIIKANYEMTGRQVTRDEALALFADNPYKVEIAREIPEGEAVAGHADHAAADVTQLSAMISDVLGSGEPDVADSLRPLYLDYLEKHGG